MFRRFACVAASAAALVSCAAEQRPLPARLDPSNPEAPEGPPALALTAAVAAGAIYTCPMHPEVRASQPGRCPKCGMALVPEEATPDAGAPQHHHHHGGEP